MSLKRGEFKRVAITAGVVLAACSSVAWMPGGAAVVTPGLFPAATVAPIPGCPLPTWSSWTAEGDQMDSHFGYSVAGAGDVNGDGYDDVVIGATRYDGGYEDEGKAYLYYGGASGLPGTPDWTAEMNNEGARFGLSVSCAGDVNGDGYSDVIVGAPDYSNGEPSEGGAFVYYGSAIGASATPDWSAELDHADSWFGVSVASAGDVNGDGYSDVVVGAMHYSDTETWQGLASMYQGSAAGLSATPNWVVVGDSAYSHLGVWVASAGDVNGDGYSDVIVGARGPYGFGPVEGRAFVYCGSDSGLSSTPDWVAESPQHDTGFGCCVACAGDVNGDGYSDVIIGAAGYDSMEVNEGVAFVYYGGASGLADSPAWIGEADQAYGAVGARVAGIGDQNGDGYDDVIVGAYRYNELGIDDGRAFIYYGGAYGLSAGPAWKADADQAGAWFGVSVAGAGDVDGNGCLDVIVGACMYDSGQSDEGGAFLYLGGSAIPATVEFDPSALDVNSELENVSCYIELMEPFDPTNINVSTVMVNDELTVLPGPTEVRDHDGDGIPALVVKFSYEDLITLVGGVVDDQVEVIVSGELFSGTPFAGRAFLSVVGDESRPVGRLGLHARGGPGAGTVTISYELPMGGVVSMRVYDAAGRFVRTLVREPKPAGNYEVIWDRKTDDGRRVCAGVYFVRLEQQGIAYVGKLLLVN
jgi:hypothetical protein